MKLFHQSATYLLFFSLLYLGCSSSGDPGPSGPGGGTPGFSYSHKQGTGSSAADFLSSADFSSLIIEIDYVEGFQPSQSAINSLQTFLQERLNKPGGITITLDESIPSPGNNAYTPQQIVDLEDEYRDMFTTENTMAAYFIILDGSYQQNNVLGVAYYNTSMALFEETIRDNSGGIGQPATSTVEASVLRHEFGHILGLVANGSDMVQDHEDTEHPKHCTVDTCLMYWAIQTTDLMGNLSGGNIPELDAQCLQDLQANGGK